VLRSWRYGWLIASCVAIELADGDGGGDDEAEGGGDGDDADGGGGDGDADGGGGDGGG